MRLPPPANTTIPKSPIKPGVLANSSNLPKNNTASGAVPLRHNNSFASSCATMVTSNCNHQFLLSNNVKRQSSSSSSSSFAEVTPDRVSTSVSSSFSSSLSTTNDSGNSKYGTDKPQQQLPQLWLENAGGGGGTEVCLTSSFVSMHLGSSSDSVANCTNMAEDTSVSTISTRSPQRSNTVVSPYIVPPDDQEDCTSSHTPQPMFCNSFMSIGDSITDLLLFKPPSQRRKKGRAKQKSKRPLASTPQQAQKNDPSFKSSKPPISPKAAVVGSPPRSRSCPNGPFLIPSCGGSYQDTPTKAIPFECGKLCSGADLMSPEIEKQRSMERNIGNMLGSTADSSSPWCGSWQSWSLSFCDGSALSPDAKPDQLGRVLRNRAGNLNSQVRRIRRLHGNATHLERSVDLKKPGSFDERLKSTLLEDLILREQKRSQRCPSECTTSACSSAAESAASTSVNAILAMAGCELREEKNKVGLLTNLTSLDADDLYYDSDPEFITSRSSREGPRPSGHRTKRATASIHDAMDLAGQVAFRKSPSAASALHHKRNANTVFPENFVFNPNNPYQIEMLIKETVNNCLVLIWHPTPSNGRSKVAPVRVKAWIELGTQLRSRLVQPKFVWKIMTEEEIQGTKSCVSNKGLQKSELLDILRVLEVKEIDRKKYPFAKKCSSLMIETLSQTLFFEAEGSVARDKLVVGLKLVIARLGSKIVTGDESVFDEFFSPFGNVDPGRPPSMFQ